MTDRRLTVIDDLLEPEPFASLHQWAREVDWYTPNQSDSEVIWHRNAPRNPAVSRAVIWPKAAFAVAAHSAIDSAQLYPTGTPVDAALRAIWAYALGSDHPGTDEADWAGIVASLFRFKAGERLLWHTDDRNYTAAFTFYVHPTWNPDWGGDLLYRPLHAAEGSGGFVTPRPNRLVLMTAGLPHCVSCVVSDSDAPRLSLSGFFVRPERVAELLAQNSVRD